MNGKTVQEDTIALIGVKFTSLNKKTCVVLCKEIGDHCDQGGKTLYGKRDKQGESCFFISEVRNGSYKTVIRNDKPPINGISLRSNIKLNLE